MSEYFIGLDIGTESVGWAVTDTQYNIQKRHGKALWGVRLFPEAQKAEERRIFRTSRRRYERRTQRIDLLRYLFSEEIAKVDPAFFQRLDESKFEEEDKKVASSGQPLGRYTLFADKNYSDIDYHKEFPTIYHLRNALLTEDRAFDVRLVYLAIHHILKKRGHFLFADMSLNAINFDLCFGELTDLLQNEYDLVFDLKDKSAFVAALTDRAMNTTQKKKALKTHSGVSKDDEQLSAIIDLLAGATVKASKICALELDKESDVSFSLKEEFEGIEQKLIESVGDGVRLICAVKRVYDWSMLENLLGGNATLSVAKVQVYEQHQKDLMELKNLFRADPALRKEMFRTEDEKIKNYAAYSGHSKIAYSCTYSDFAAYTKKKITQLLPKLDESGAKNASSIIEKLDMGVYLQKQTSKDNGIIPHQLHEKELALILSRAEKYLPFLLAKDNSGLTVSEKILAIFRFRIPYYVGPLNPASPFSWIVRSDEKITPWNFDMVVDLSASAERFITRMTATCSYLGEKVLPKDSLLYSKFVTLNMINKIKINGNELPISAKQSLFTNRIAQDGSATTSSIKSFLISNGYMQKSDEFSGIDSTFKVSLPGYKVFRRILERPDSFDMVEDIIKHIVLFGEDRKLLESWLTREYGKSLSSDDIAYIMRNRNRFSGWGNLSKEFLSGIEHFDPETGEVFTIIGMLWHTNHNLMELLSSGFDFAQKIADYREQKFAGKKPTLADYLKDSYASPGIRRSIHQTIGIISEIEKIMGGEPKRVFVEVTREEGAKERTVSRKRQLDDLYAACKKEAPDVFEELGHFDDPALRSAKLYLYFTQLGRCMYSGERIDLDRLAVDYDIDHIYPQRVVKDDSITNRVLVKRQLNAEKSDHYPLSDAIRTRMLEHWRLLKRKELISEEKYRRLTRNTPFQDNELSGFIARQLVETSQACKIVAELLKKRYGGVDR
ncbi:MAG: type II CRISPR RNA-guided endonuclease Cas9, partial [Clostridia bacterium]|nr:type II CRISPR RNA-guided endonuclease Cas9 [Clostridia bacterium]